MIRLQYHVEGGVFLCETDLTVFEKKSIQIKMIRGRFYLKIIAWNNLRPNDGMHFLLKIDLDSYEF